MDVPQETLPIPADVAKPRKKRVAKDPTDVNEAAEDFGLSIFDLADARSVANTVPPLTKAAMSRIGPELRKMGEDALRDSLAPDSTLCRLRVSFWEEYERAQVNGVYISIPRVTQGVCTRDYWDTVVIVEPRYLAWILCPPKDYTLAMKEMLDLGMGRLREVLNMPFKDPTTGRIDTKAMALVIGVTKYLDARVKGAIIQRIEGRTQNLHVHADGTPLMGQAVPPGERRRSGRALPAGDVPKGLIGHDAENEMEELERLEQQLKEIGARALQRAEELVCGGDESDIDIESRFAPTAPDSVRARPVEVHEAEYSNAEDPDDAEGQI